MLAEQGGKPVWADARLWTLLMVPAAVEPAALFGSSDLFSLFNRIWLVGVLTPVIVALAVAGAVLAWRRRPLPALLVTAAYGVLVGVLPALAALLVGVGAPLGSAIFLLPLLPAVPAAWTLMVAWLEDVAPIATTGAEQRSRVRTRATATLAGYALVEALVLGGLVLGLGAPCNGTASQTACSTTIEELTGALCSFAVIFPVLAPILLGLLLKKEELTLRRTLPPGAPPR